MALKVHIGPSLGISRLIKYEAQTKMTAQINPNAGLAPEHSTPISCEWAIPQKITPFKILIFDLKHPNG